MINFGQMGNRELLETYEQRDSLSNDDTLNLLAEISKRWAKREKFKQLPLKAGDDIWYVDPEEIRLEHGTVFFAGYNDSAELVSFSVNFDDGDFDEFEGTALNIHYFKDKDDAWAALYNSSSNS